ncbi:MAG: GGDEF domain-containing protein [Blautia sp.]|nr:GGDEF domain-containing protein [Blautia sp.]
MDTREIIRKFIQEDIGGIMITDASGKVIYADAEASQLDPRGSNWAIACPRPQKGQRAVAWDLVDSVNEKTYMVLTSTFEEEGELKQIHHFTDITIYTDIYRNISEYTSTLKQEKEHDHMTGLFNKGKFMEWKRTLFRNCDTITIFNLDVNNLKYTNDTYGHETGDRLIKKAAESLHRVSARNVMGFRMGGDEFLLVGLHLSREEAESLYVRWKKALCDLNQAENDIVCSMACGRVFGEKDCDLDMLLSLADQRMYEDKNRIKAENS